MSAYELIVKNFHVWVASSNAHVISRGNRKKNDFHGIKKLRELILELAVRGKLTPQDNTDEDAAILLERIAKIRLEKNGMSKKISSYRTVDDKDKLFESPPGWRWVRLGEVVDIIRGITFPSSEKSTSPEAGRVACLRTTNVQNAVEWEDLLYIRQEFVSRDEQYLQFHDVVMSMANSRELVGKVALIESELGQRSTFGGFLSVIRPLIILPKFIMLYFRTPKVREALIGSASQTTNIANISLSKLNPLPFAVPPIAEQHRIVAKVDELMTFCDKLEQNQSDNIAVHAQLVSVLLATLTNSRDNAELKSNWLNVAQHFNTLFTTEHSIEQLKETILQLAVMGKIVPQDPNDQPASELLKQIAAEKAQLIKEGKIRKEKLLPKILDQEKPFELPDGWEWCRIGNVAALITSGSRDWAKHLSDEGAIFVTMANLSRGDYKLRTDTMRYVNPPTNGEGTRTKLEENDLLVSITGDVGNLGLIPKNFGEAYINQHTCLIRFMPVCQNLYFPEVLRSPFARAQFAAPQRGIKNSFRLGDVEGLIIPVPPLNEQHRIVVKVQELIDLCNILKSNLQNVQITQLALADALVELVIGHGRSAASIEKSKENTMNIITPLAVVPTATLKSDAFLAKIIESEGAEIDAKKVWKKSKMDLPTFYKQLKLEIAAGYIVKPLAARF